MFNKKHILFFIKSLGLPSRFATTHSSLRVRGTGHSSTWDRLLDRYVNPWASTLAPRVTTPECTLVRSDLHKLWTDTWVWSNPRSGGYPVNYKCNLSKLSLLAQYARCTTGAISQSYHFKPNMHGVHPVQSLKAVNASPICTVYIYTLVRQILVNVLVY